MDKLRVGEVILVEGRYDAAAVASLVDALVLTTGGFSIFSDEEKKELVRRLGRERGLVILTDSDAAGFRIRSYVEKIAAGCAVKHAYIPGVAGKESRKQRPSREGMLGVEGMTPEVLRQALERTGVNGAAPRRGRGITYTDLYEWGLSGGADSARRRRDFLRRLGLPPRLSKKALREVLSSLYTYEELTILTRQKPVLFWDFHGTLTTPDINWYDCAMEAATEAVPEVALSREVLESYLSGTCLPWWSVPSRDTRHLTKPGAWWRHCEVEFAQVYRQCGYTEAQAERIAPRIREKILQPSRYELAPGAIDTLEELRRRGYESYILSNNFPELAPIVEAVGLAGLVRGTIVSGEVGYDKPRPEIFAAARARAGRPDEVWMIGDNPKDDITGAKQAGFRTISVRGRASEDADFVVEALPEILDILQ